MSYATQQDLIDRFGERELVELTDRSGARPSAIDPVVVGRHIADADAFVDGYVGKAYRLPIASVPPVLTKIAADVARYYLHGKRAEKDGPVERAYREAVRWLEGVARGLVQIDVGGETPPAPGGGSVQITAPSRRFGRDTMRGL